MKKSCLITGGCGFLGIALIKRFLSENIKNIRIIDNLSVGKINDLKNVCDFRKLDASEVKHSPQGVELIVGDVLDDKLAINITKGCEMIVHFAANTGVGPSVENPRADMMTNIFGTFNYLEASRINKVSRFIFASSGAPIGEADPPIHEELAPHPVSPYGASKLAGEGYCSAYKKTFNLDTVILRFGNVYGPGSIHKSSVVAKFIQKALAGEVLEIYGDGNQTRDFIFIDDLIDAIILSLTSDDIGGEIFQISSNKETAIEDLKNIIVAELINRGIKNTIIKNVLKRVGDVKRNYSDTAKAKKKLGWKPRVQLKVGISRTVSYFLDNSSTGYKNE